MSTPFAKNRSKTVMAWLRRLGLLAAIVFAAHMDVRSWNSFVDWIFDRQDEAQPLDSIGAPIFAKRGDTARVYVLSARHRFDRTRRWTVSRLSGRNELRIVLWAFDASTMQLLWYRDTGSEPDDDMTEVALLGIDGDTIWLHAGGLRALDADDGRPLIDSAGIATRNPELAGRFVASHRYYGFDHNGLYLTDALARQWRIDARTFAARPVETEAVPARIEAVRPAHYFPDSTNAFRARGVDIGTNWLGVLTDEEADRLSRPPVVPGSKPGERRRAMEEYLQRQHLPSRLDPVGSGRFRLWRAHVEQVSAAPDGWPADFPDNWGTYPVYSDYASLPAAPVFLAAGLLDRGEGDSPVWLRGPDSVLVLHRDRLGEEGRLRLARVAGPDGRVVWDAALPLSIVQSVMADEDRLVLFGREYRPAESNRPHDPYHDADQRLVSIDPDDGRIVSFNFNVDGRAVLDAVIGEDDQGNAE